MLKGDPIFIAVRYSTCKIRHFKLEMPTNGKNIGGLLSDFLKYTGMFNQSITI